MTFLVCRRPTYSKEAFYIPPMTPPRERYQNRTEILQGTLDMLILQVLQWGPRHGYALSKAIRTNSGEILKVDTGSLYPALHRLERKGWIDAEWEAVGDRSTPPRLSPDKIRPQAIGFGAITLGHSYGSDRWHSEPSEE